MKLLQRFSFVISLSIMSLYGICQESRIINRELSLKDAARWIQNNIQLPQDIEEYSMIGTEQFVISAAWDGRIFISSPLHTLNPSFERVIEETVARAPKCKLSGEITTDIYELVEIDFAAMYEALGRSNFVDISRHTFPMFSNQKARDDSREKFVEWLSARYERSAKVELYGYADTILLNYTISKTGELTNPSVSDCRDEQLRKVLAQNMRKSPGWAPAIASNYMPVPVSICERVIIQVDESGKKHPLKLLRSAVCQNSIEPTGDQNMLVLNPEIKPRLLGEYKNLGRLLAERVEFEAPTEYACSFIIERDGSVGEIKVEVTDKNAGRAIAEQIRQTCWTPAMQGGQAVRTNYYLHEKRGPKPTAELVYAMIDHYPHFMTEGRYAPFVYDDQAQQRRWKRFKEAYPAAAATIHGYGQFRRLDNMKYIEALSIRNALQPVVKPANKKSR